MSRSCAVVLHHLIDRYELYLRPTFQHLMNCRPTAEVIPNHKLQLALFEYERLGKSSVQRHAGKYWNFYEWNL